MIISFGYSSINGYFHLLIYVDTFINQNQVHTCTYVCVLRKSVKNSNFNQRNCFKTIHPEASLLHLLATSVNRLEVIEIQIELPTEITRSQRRNSSKNVCFLFHCDQINRRAFDDPQPSPSSLSPANFHELFP